MKNNFSPQDVSEVDAAASISKQLSAFQATLRELARRYAEHGHAVIPMKDKTPLVVWKQYQTRIPTDIERQRQPWEEANGIALVVGQGQSNSGPHPFVLDIEDDHREDAETWLDAELPDWRFAASARSRYGGLHVYCSCSDPVQTQRFRWGDVKGSHSLVVLPPSQDKYEWISTGRPLQINLNSFSSILDHPSEVRFVSRKHQKRCASKTALGTVVSDLANQDHSVRKILWFLNIDPGHWDRGSAFLCPICDEEHPSASLIRSDSGCAVLRCWHAGKEDCPGEDFVLLPSVYAHRVTGEFKRLQGGELAAWSLRLLVDAGVIMIKKPRLALRQMSSIGRKLVQGIAEIQEIAKHLIGNSSSVAFTRSFGMVWCGFSATELEKAWQALRGQGVVVSTGKNGLITLWSVNVAEQNPTPGPGLYEDCSEPPPPNSLCSRGQSNPRDVMVKRGAAGGEPEN